MTPLDLHVAIRLALIILIPLALSAWHQHYVDDADKRMGRTEADND